MVGVLFVIFGAFLGEVSITIGKRAIAKRVESIYSFGFLNGLWATVFLGALSIIFIFQNGLLGHMPIMSTFALRMPLEILQAYVAIRAISEANRTSHGFLMTLTIPLLLMVDLFLGYGVSGFQVIGMILISLGVLFLFMNHGISKKGLFFVLAGAVNAVITISLYKYGISNGNSWQFEQFFAHIILLSFFFYMASRGKRKNPLHLLKKPKMLLQSAAGGLGSVVLSYAYVFAAASVITAAKRSASVVFSVVSGSAVFHEKHVRVKIFATFVFIAGIIFLTIQ